MHNVNCAQNCSCKMNYCISLNEKWENQGYFIHLFHLLREILYEFVWGSRQKPEKYFTMSKHIWYPMSDFCKHFSLKSIDQNKNYRCCENSIAVNSTTVKIIIHLRLKFAKKLRTTKLHQLGLSGSHGNACTKLTSFSHSCQTFA